jgi:hypothetical protein
MMAKRNFFQKFVNEKFTAWGMLITIVTLISNILFCISVGKAICKSAPASEAYIFSTILALISLNMAVTFFIPMLITKHQVTDTVKEVVDKTLVEKNMVQYATQMNIADLLQKVSSLLFGKRGIFGR